MSIEKGKTYYTLRAMAKKSLEAAAKKFKIGDKVVALKHAYAPKDYNPRFIRGDEFELVKKEKGIFVGKRLNNRPLRRNHTALTKDMKEFMLISDLDK